MTEARVCKKCGIEKPLTEEFFRPHRHASGFRWACRECEQKAQATRYAENPEKYCAVSREYGRTHRKERSEARKTHRVLNPEQHKNSVLKRTYGISLAEYQALFVAQNGVCGICKTETVGSRGRKLHVDHCHVTGRVRGLLCGKCNSILGFSGDRPEIPEAALLWD